MKPLPVDDSFEMQSLVILTYLVSHMAGHPFQLLLPSCSMSTEHSPAAVPATAAILVSARDHGVMEYLRLEGTR